MSVSEQIAAESAGRADGDGPKAGGAGVEERLTNVENKLDALVAGLGKALRKLDDIGDVVLRGEKVAPIDTLPCGEGPTTTDEAESGTPCSSQQAGIMEQFRDGILIIDDDDDDDSDGASMNGSFKESEPLDLPPVILVESSAWMVSPKNKFRMYWDIGVIAPLLVYFAVIMPFRLCFAAPTPKWEIGVDVIFIADIVLSFRTGYFVANALGEEEFSVEYDRRKVALNYAKTWLIPDVVSGIPFSILDVAAKEAYTASRGAAGPLKLVKLIKLLRVVKLGRLFKVEKILQNLDRSTLDHIGDFLQRGNTRSVVLFSQLAFVLAFVCHLFACGFVLVGRMGSKRGGPNWLESEMGGPFEASDTEKGGQAVNSIYLAAFYYALTTIVSVGYGDIIPRNNGERLFAILCEFIGAAVFAMIIAAFTNVLSSMDTNQRATQEQLDAVSSFVNLRGFPDDLGRRIRRHFRHFYANKAAIDESRIFSELSTGLRKEVSQFLVSDLVGMDSFLTKVSPVLWPRLLPLLRPMRYEAGETICRQGEECTEMYILLSGRLLGSTVVESGDGDDDDAGVVVVDEEPRVRHTSPGGHFNVLCVLGVWKRCVETAVVSERTWAEIYALNAKDFAGLFTGLADIAAFHKMQRREVCKYKMDPFDVDAPTEFGRPLHMCCFTTVQLTLVKVRGLLTAAATTGGGHSGGGTNPTAGSSSSSSSSNSHPSSFRNGESTSSGSSGGGLGGGLVGGLRRSMSMSSGGDRSPTSGRLRRVASGGEVSRRAGQKWVVADLVEMTGTNKPFNEIWSFTTSKTQPSVLSAPSSTTHKQQLKQQQKHLGFSKNGSWRALSEPPRGDARRNADIAAAVAEVAQENDPAQEPFWGEVVRWMDVSVPFDKAGVRVRVFETDKWGRDLVVAHTLLRLSDLEQKCAQQQKHSLASGAAAMQADMQAAAVLQLRQQSSTMESMGVGRKLGVGGSADSGAAGSAPSSPAPYNGGAKTRRSSLSEFMGKPPPLMSRARYEDSSPASSISSSSLTPVVFPSISGAGSSAAAARPHIEEPGAWRTRHEVISKPLRERDGEVESWFDLDDGMPNHSTTHSLWPTAPSFNFKGLIPATTRHNKVAAIREVELGGDDDSDGEAKSTSPAATHPSTIRAMSSSVSSLLPPIVHTNSPRSPVPDTKNTKKKWRKPKKNEAASTADGSIYLRFLVRRPERSTGNYKRDPEVRRNSADGILDQIRRNSADGPMVGNSGRVPSSSSIEGFMAKDLTAESASLYSRRLS